METELRARPIEAQAAGEDAVAVLVKGLARRYPAGRRGESLVVLEGIDLRVRPGEVLGILGPSGCGKSTLLELIAGLQEPDEGDVRVEGHGAPAERLERCAYMPQRDCSCRGATPPPTPPSPSSRRASAAGRRAAGRSRCCVASTLRSSSARCRASSRGMRQRVAFVRTLLAGRPVLLLDEPFAALDSITRAGLQEWLAEALTAEARTVVLVTHDVDEALYLSDRVVTLTERPGRVSAEIEVSHGRSRPRRETVTDPAFAALRARAMEALEC